MRVGRRAYSRATKAAIPASSWATAHRSPVGRRAISRWAFATSIPTQHGVADIITPDWPGLARYGRTWLRATVRAHEGVDVTTHAPLRSRWTSAVPVYHVRVTGNADALPSPSKDTTLFAVACRPLILMEAPSSADRRGTAEPRKRSQRRGGALRRFSTTPHHFYCGIDWHARTRYLCLLNRDGEIRGHRNMPASPAPFLKTIAPDREDVVVCVEYRFTWDLAG
jgi:hypothetical protein